MRQFNESDATYHTRDAAPMLPVFSGNPERVLLLNPAVFDTRFPWARWTQPTVLLRLASHFAYAGAEIKIVDALERRPSERLRRELLGAIDLDGIKVNRWRFGHRLRDLEVRLLSVARSGWIPDQIFVESITTVWWQGAEEIVSLAKRIFPTSELVLVGTYPELAPTHAVENSSADIVVETLPRTVTRQICNVNIYECVPSFTYVSLHNGERDAENVVDEIRTKSHRRVVRQIAFMDQLIGSTPESLDTFQNVLQQLAEARLRVRLYVIGNIAPSVIVANPELAVLMKQAGFAEIHFADDRLLPSDQETEDRLVDDYVQAASLLHAAGFPDRKANLSGSVSIGRRHEDLRQRVQFATRVVHAIGSLVLWPYQPTPQECPELPLEEQNGKLFPFRQENGVTYRDYLDFLGVAAVLNAKYRQRSFDFLGSGLIPTLFRRSIQERAWDPPEEVKGSLRVLPASSPQATSEETRTVFLPFGESGRRAQVLTESTFSIPSGPAGFKRVLLVSPPVYDAQYWARWSQPAGLLRIATYLRQQGYALDLIDCMEADAKGYVPKTRRLIDGMPYVVERDDVRKIIYHFGLPWHEIQRRLQEIDPPDQIWISSIMTYWWESTRDLIAMVRQFFPNAEIIVGGIYPTLAPDHAAENLGADVVFVGEITAASNLPTDLSLYRTPPTYALLTTSRGCPWHCHYCSARTLNGGSNKMRARDPEDVLEEIEYKKSHFGIRRFGFYEDNALALRGHLQRILELIIERGLSLDLYAPEGFETRLLTVDLLKTMKQAGFEKIHLPFEALRWETNVGWNRRHASTASFERALDAAIQAGFRPRTEQINAFVLFGLPDDALELILDGVLYVHHMVGSIIPMLFTPVPGTHVYQEHEGYLTQQATDDRKWDLQDLNGKFVPFVEYNRRRYPGLRASHYLQLEALMSVLNAGKVLRRSVNLCDDSPASDAFRHAAGTFERQLIRG